MKSQYSMTKTNLVIFISFLLLLLIGLATAETNDVAIVQADDNGQVFHNGDQISITGTGFMANDNIKYVVLTLLDEKSRNLGYLFTEQYDLQLNNTGEVSGFVKLDLIPFGVAKVVVQLMAEKTSVQGSNMILVEGDKNLSTSGIEFKKAGTVTISDATFGNNNGQAAPFEILTTTGTGWVSTNTSSNALQNEYSDAAGTIQINQVSPGADNTTLTTGTLGGWVRTTNTFLTSSVSIRIQIFAFPTFETATSNVYLIEDTTPPSVVSVNATSQTNIEVVFDESVSEVGNSLLRFSTTASGQTLSSISGSGTTWNITISPGYSTKNPDGTLSYSQSGSPNTDELQDGGGNEVTGFSGITIGDQIVPTTPNLTAPVTSSIMDGSSFDLTATADNGTTDPSLAGVRFDGKNGAGSWNTIGTDNNTTDTDYSFTYNFGTKYDYYRAVAVDNASNEAVSGSSALLTDAYRIQITSYDATIEAGQRSNFNIAIQDNYAQAVAYGSNLSFNLTTTASSGAAFYDAASGGNQITSVVITNPATTATFWYQDDNANTTPTVTVTESASNLEDDNDSRQITVNAVSKHFHVTTENSESEQAGTSFGITVALHNDSDHSVVTSYTGAHSLTWSTSATASPDGTTPSIPADGDQTFSNGAVTISNGGTLYNSSETPNITVTDGVYNTLTTSAGNAGYQIAVADGNIAEVRIKTADETTNGNYDSNIYGSATFQGPTQASPTESTDLWAVNYDAYGNLRPDDETSTWGTTGTVPGSYSSGIGSSVTFTFDGTGSTGSETSGTLTNTSSGNTGATGTITVDDDDGATVTGFGVTTDGGDNTFVYASWSGSSSGDNGTSGTPTSYDVRWTDEANGPIDTGTEWDNATSVGSGNKPAFSVGTWHIDMSGFPAGNKYFAIRTTDDVGNVSVLGSGAYTTSSDYSLPVELISFEAQSDYSKVTLTWTTASEIENLGFNIYRAEANAENSWQQVNEVMIPGQGNSADETDYEFVDENVVAEQTYQYKLESVSVNGEIELQQLVEVTIPVPKAYVLFNNHPNPFNPTTNLKFQLPNQSQVSVTIYDIQGHVVKKLLQNQSYTAGEHTAQWDATDELGQKVATGMYIYRFTAGNYQKLGKMMLIK